MDPMKETPAESESAGAQRGSCHATQSGRDSSCPKPDTRAVEALRANPAASVDFLQAWLPTGPWLLAAIPPDGGGLHAAEFGPGQEGALRSWLTARAGRCNIYYHSNVVHVRRDASGRPTKATKADVRQFVGAHVDVDPRAGEDVRAERERILAGLREHRLAPTVIVDSGGGYQALWRLDEPVPVGDGGDSAEELEGINLALARSLDGDKCHDLCHLLRLPGTINVPDAKKRARGRKRALAAVVEFRAERVYPRSAFDVVKPRGEAVGQRPALAAIPANVPRLGSVDELPDKVSDRVKMLIVQGSDPDDPTKYGSRSEALFAVCCELVRAGCSDETIFSVITDPDFGISASVLDKSNHEKYALRQIEQARGVVGPELPTIYLRAGEIPAVLDEAEAALLGRAVPLYQRAGGLVRVSRLDVDQREEGVRRHDGALTILDVNKHWLREQFSRSASWRRRAPKSNEGTDSWKPVDPPFELCQHYLSRVGEWKLPVLKGIIEAPTLREDYSILDQPGYDEASGLILDSGDTKFPPISNRPSRADAEVALAKLVEVIRHFPFVPDGASDTWEPSDDEGLRPSASRSVVLSAILTGLIRRSLSTAPLHGIEAPEKGTGKSLIADIVAILLTGRRATVMSQGHDPVEDQKRLLAVLLQGDPILVVDNVERVVEGDALCSILTQATWQSRILGRSESVAVPTNCLIVATGNNLTFRGDMTRRVVVCRLDARRERPDERQFDFDPRQMAGERRGELVAAGLTMILAYVADGRPVQDQVKSIGSFEDWDIVREVLVWLGQPDPADTRERVLDEDPEKAQLGEMMDAWDACFGDRWMRMGDVVEELERCGADGGEHGRLRRLLASVCRNGTLSAKSAGWWFRGRAGKVVGDRRFLRKEDRKQGAMVRLEGGGPAPDWSDRRRQAPF